MNRYIKFRGKLLYRPTEWVYGYYNTITTDNLHYIKPFDCDIIEEVDPKTVGQFLGNKDKHNNEICQGDILLFKYKFMSNEPYIRLVEWDDYVCGFNPFAEYDDNYRLSNDCNKCEIIGNIHDDPELLENNK